MIAIVFPDIILLIVGRKENKKGKPTINFQCFDLIIGSNGGGKNRNQGSDSRMNKLLVMDSMLLHPSNKTGLEVPRLRYTSVIPEILQQRTERASHTWPKSFCFFPMCHQIPKRERKANIQTANCHQP